MSVGFGLRLSLVCFALTLTAGNRVSRRQRSGLSACSERFWNPRKSRKPPRNWKQRYRPRQQEMESLQRNSRDPATVAGRMPAN